MWNTAFEKFEAPFHFKRLSSTNFTWPILECFVPYIVTRYFLEKAVWVFLKKSVVLLTLSKIDTYSFNISNVDAKASGLNLGKKLSNLLCNREALNQKSTFFLAENYFLRLISVIWIKPHSRQKSSFINFLYIMIKVSEYP